MTKTVKIPFWGLCKCAKAWLLRVPAAENLSVSATTDGKSFCAKKLFVHCFSAENTWNTPLWHGLQPNPLFFFHSKREKWACTRFDVVRKAEGISIQLKIVWDKWVASIQVDGNFIRNCLHPQISCATLLEVLKLFLCFFVFIRIECFKCHGKRVSRTRRLFKKEFSLPRFNQTCCESSVMKFLFSSTRANENLPP